MRHKHERRNTQEYIDELNSAGDLSPARQIIGLSKSDKKQKQLKAVKDINLDYDMHDQAGKQLPFDHISDSYDPVKGGVEDKKVSLALDNLKTNKQTTKEMFQRVYSIPSEDKIKAKKAKMTGQIPSSINVYGSHYPVVKLLNDNTLLLHTSDYGNEGKTKELVNKIKSELPNHFPDFKVVEVNHPDYRHSAELMRKRNPKALREFLDTASREHPDENYRQHALDSIGHLYPNIKKGEFSKPIRAKRTAGEGWDGQKNTENRVGKIHTYLSSLGLSPDTGEGNKRSLGAKSPASVTINSKGDPHDQQLLHEGGHAMLTPEGSTMQEYQTSIGSPGYKGKLHQTKFRSELKDIHEGGMPEQAAQQMEAGIARRSGVNPFKSPQRGTKADSEIERSRAHAKNQLKMFDEGIYRFDPFSGENELQANPNTLINARRMGDKGLLKQIHDKFKQKMKAKKAMIHEDEDDWKMAASENTISDMRKSVGRLTTPKEKGVSSRPDQQVYPVSMWSGKRVTKEVDPGGTEPVFEEKIDYPTKKIQNSFKNDKYQDYSRDHKQVGSQIASKMKSKGESLNGIFIPSKNNFAATGRSGDINTTGEHEGFHYLSEQIRQKHGPEKHHAFLKELVGHIHPKVQQVIHRALQSNDNYRAMANSSKPRFQSAYLEEVVNLNRDMLTKKSLRNSVKKMHNVDEKGRSLMDNPMHEHLYRDFDSRTKNSWKRMMNHAKNYQFGQNAQEEKLAASENINNDLRKAPLIMNESVSDEIGGGSMVPPIHSQSKHITTNKLKSGLYHHVTEKGGGTAHHLSTSSDPHDDMANVAYLHTTPTMGKHQVSLSKVRKDQAGKGHGKQLYLSALAHHGEMISDKNLTDRSHGVWSSLPELSQGHVQVRLANTTDDVRSDDSVQTHHAKADREKLSKLMFQGRIKPKMGKLAASEDTISDLSKADQAHKTGDRIHHPKHGTGTVRKPTNDGHVMVNFDSNTSKDYSGIKIHPSEFSPNIKKGEISRAAKGIVLAGAMAAAPYVFDGKKAQDLTPATSREVAHDITPKKSFYTQKIEDSKYKDRRDKFLDVVGQPSKIVIKEYANKDPVLRAKYGHLGKLSHGAFADTLSKNKGMVGEFATKHYDDLYDKYAGNTAHVAYAWKHGKGGMDIANKEGQDVSKHPYVRNVIQRLKTKP